MDASTMASVGALGVAALSLWRSLSRESVEKQDKRIREVVALELGADMAILKKDVRRVIKHLGINGDE